MSVDFKKHSYFVAGIIVVSAVLIIRLFSVQIIDKQYKLTAENNAFRYDTRYPARGLILDRNGKILVENMVVYDIMITPYEVSDLDTADLCDIFGLDIEQVKKTLKDYKKNRKKIGYQTLPFFKQANNKQYAMFLEKAYKFKGFNAISRSIRTYPFNAGGNILGYVNEVDTSYMRRHPEYKRGDYVGRTGIEQSYERILRGRKGYRIYLRDVNNKIQSDYKEGKYDKEAVPGYSITSSIDGDLQSYGESLMKNKVGSIVAIEPSSGEILAIVSSPGFDVEKLSSMNKYYSELVNDPLKPMFNRAVMSPYPPGSVFKIVNGLIALQENVLDTLDKHSCNMGYTVGNLTVACHAHPSPIDIKHAVMMSCNAFFCEAFRDIIDNKKYGNTQVAFSRWKEFVESFGFGQKLGSDIPSEKGGILPTIDTYDRIHGKNRWKSLSIISLAIGQGEIGTTPLHLANLAAIIANRGYYYTPHLIKGSPDTLINADYSTKHYTKVDRKHFDVLVEGMSMAVNSPPGSGATASRVAIPGIEMCGKTGTAQNPHGKDHSVFISFAPRKNPEIAIAVYIENSGFGATWAAPVASLMTEFYLRKGVVERKDLEKHIQESNTIILNK